MTFLRFSWTPLRSTSPDQRTRPKKWRWSQPNSIWNWITICYSKTPSSFASPIKPVRISCQASSVSSTTCRRILLTRQAWAGPRSPSCRVNGWKKPFMTQITQSCTDWFSKTTRNLSKRTRVNWILWTVKFRTPSSSWATLPHWSPKMKSFKSNWRHMRKINGSRKMLKRILRSTLMICSLTWKIYRIKLSLLNCTWKEQAELLIFGAALMETFKVCRYNSYQFTSHIQQLKRISSNTRLTEFSPVKRKNSLWGDDTWFTISWIYMKSSSIYSVNSASKY